MNHVFTLDQIEALAAFARENGRTWKMKLRSAWERSDCDSPLLQLRNAGGFGPRGLAWISPTDIRDILQVHRFIASEELRLQNLFAIA